MTAARAALVGYGLAITSRNPLAWIEVFHPYGTVSFPTDAGPQPPRDGGFGSVKGCPHL